MEMILKTIIDELGATGLLVAGLYLVLYKPLKEVAAAIRTINKNTLEIDKNIEIITEIVKEDSIRKQTYQTKGM